MAFIWTDARIERAKQLYVVQGLSAAETAAAMGGDCTRNSVIGKAHRMGWMKEHRQKPTSTGRPVRAAEAKAAPPAPVRPAPFKANANGRIYPMPEVKPLDVVASPANDTSIRLMDRRFGQCAWPVGEPERPAALMCCGRRSASGSSYCTEHKRIAGTGKVYTPKEMLRSVRRFA